MLLALYQFKNLNDLGLVSAICRERKMPRNWSAKCQLCHWGLGYEDYYSGEVPSCYGEVRQRWFLFLNKKCRLSAQKKLTRKMQKQSLKEARDLEKLGKKSAQSTSGGYLPGGRNMALDLDIFEQQRW